MLDLISAREALEYCPISGVVRWKENRPSNHFFNESAYKVYIARFSGKPAGHSIKIGNTSYLQIRIFSKLYLAHRLAWFLYYGVWPSNQVDHLDGNGENNAIWNLRDKPNYLNGRNCRMSKNNTSGVNGVYFHKQTRKWIAEGHYTENGLNKKTYLGVYSLLEDAEKARLDWEELLGGFTERHGKPLVT